MTLYAANEVGFPEAIEGCNKKAGGRYSISYVPLPRTADAQRELMARRLAAEDTDIDLLSMDIPWTAEFAEAGWIREWPGARGQKALEGRLQGPQETVQYQDKIWATPFTTNGQLLFYRKDKVKKPPEDFTWDDMIDDAERLKTGIEVQAARYEGLVVWINSLVASGGGSLIDEDGEPAARRDHREGRGDRLAPRQVLRGRAAGHVQQPGGPGPAGLRGGALLLPGELQLHLRRPRRASRGSRTRSAGRAGRGSRPTSRAT